MKLTAQEDKVLQLTATGMSAKEIADKLFISPVTAQNHLHHIKNKLNLQKSTELVAYYWCSFFGSSLAEQRRAFGSFFLIGLIGFQIFTFNPDLIRVLRVRNSRRKTETELIIW